MTKTTKKENLLNYVKDAVIEHIKENGKDVIIVSFKDVKKYVNKVFYDEMLKHNNMYIMGKISRYSLFKDWIMGLCFISPMAEDLEPFTRYKKNYIDQEMDVLNKLIFYYYINNNDYFLKVVNE